MNNSTTTAKKRVYSISPHEQEILHLIAHEKTSKEIASIWSLRLQINMN